MILRLGLSHQVWSMIVFAQWARQTVRGLSVNTIVDRNRYMYLCNGMETPGIVEL